MIRSLLIYAIAFAVLLAIVHLSLNTISNQLGYSIRFDTFKTNLFFAIISFLICACFHILSNINRIKPQLSFVYLPTLFVKGIFFFAFFKSSVFNIVTFSVIESLALLIPFLIFLALEVYFIVKILNKV